MSKRGNLTRIYSKGTVYLVKAEADEKLQKDVQPVKKICGIDCVSEAAYNRYLGYISSFKDALNLEITSMSTLSASAKIPVYKSCYALTDEVSDDVKAKGIKEIGDLAEQILCCKEDLLDWYESDKEALEDETRYDFAALHELGLDVQFLTYINTENNRPRLKPFLAGKGVFRELLPDDIDECLLNPTPTSDEIRFPMMEDYVIKPMDTDRDFREHPATDNLLWCFTHLQMDKPWENIVVGIDNDSISFATDTEMIYALLNPQYEHYVCINGIVDFEELV